VKTSKLPRITAALLVAITLTGLLTSTTAGKNSWDRQAQARKADYMFMEAMRINSMQTRPEDYFATIRRAQSLDTSDIDIAAELGYYEWAISADSAMHRRGMNRLRRHFEADPTDFFWSSLYATAARRDYNLPEVVRIEAVLDSIYPDRIELSLRYSEDLGMLAAAGDTAAFNRSLAILRRIEKGVGKEPWLVTRKVRLYSGVKDTAAIMNEVAELLTADPKSSSNNLIAGSIYAFFDKPDSAIRYYNLACELDPSNADAVMARAEFFRENGDSTAYDREVFNALQLNSLDVEVKTQMLTGYVRELYADTTAAQQLRINDLFGVMLEQHPHEAVIHSLYGSYLALMQRYNEATEQFRYATDLDPTQIDVWRYYISAAGQSENYEELITATSRAAEFFPDEYWWYLMQSLGYMNIDRIDLAVESIDSGLAISSIGAAEQSQLITTKADLLYKKDPADSTAFALYDKALKLDPSNYMAMNNLAYYLAVAGRDIDRAESLAHTAISSSPDNATFIDTYAWTLFKSRKYDLAKEYIDKALNLFETQGDNPDNNEASAEVLEHAGDIYYMCGDPDKALDFWKKALKIAPDNELLARKVRYKAYLYK